MLGVAVFNEFAGAKLAAPFYAKAEFGVHWGINWKLRATYITKSPTSFSENRYDILTNDFPVAGEFQANDQLIFSLFVQPFSFGWE